MQLTEEERKLVDRLICFDITRQVPANFINPQALVFSKEDLFRLLSLASGLAFENNYSSQHIAYDIATKIIRNFQDDEKTFYDAAYVILSRLGNFPGRKFLKNEYDGLNDSEFKSGSFLGLEVAAREIENELLINDESLLLTDFQKVFFDSVNRERFFSTSAPTSAGKSYIFTLSIVNRIINNPTETIVLVVPTRALIRELVERITKNVRRYYDLNRVVIRAVPVVEDLPEGRGRIYVLTQERLTTLLNVDQEGFRIDTIFIDEAQEIQNERGITLQNVLEVVLEKYSDVNMFFASPLIKNPEYFSSILNVQQFSGNNYVEEVSPVGQNLIFLSSVNRKVKQANVSVYVDDKEVPLGLVEFDFKFRNSEQIIELARKLTQEGDSTTLIYCNGPSSAETLAIKMADTLPVQEQDEHVRNLIEFIREDVHPNYSLIHCLRKGVMYHYGFIPTSIRTELEKLASMGKIKYVFCTSTLLQGVNLPAKNLIVSDPKKGQRKPMGRSDFLNLIGRAGRLLHEFHGNIWCIEPNVWESRSFEGERLQEISAYYEDRLMKEPAKILDALEETDPKELMTYGKFYIDFVIGNKTIENYSGTSAYETLQTILEKSQAMNIQLPNELIRKHYSIHPKKLQELYSFFLQAGNLRAYLPKRPYQAGNYDRLQKISRIIEEKLYGNFHNSYQLYSVIAYQWIHDKTIKYIISQRPTQNETLSSTIRSTLKLLEETIRFKFVMATAAYIDVLLYVMGEQEIEVDMEAIPNLPLHLECGTANPMTISLISLGLSRTTSIQLSSSRVFQCDDQTPSSCYAALQNIDLETLDISSVCKGEIRSFVD